MAAPRIAAGILVGVIVIACAAVFAVVWRPSIAAVKPPPASSFDAVSIRRGRDLASLGNCNDCHMVRGGQAFAGGLPVPTPFGTIFSANITPDPETGIGQWSEAAFVRAMKSGVDRTGQHLYPTFPYDHFTNVSDDDDRALYAYLMTRPPVRAAVPANDVRFPFNQRPLLAGWKLLFLHHDSYQADPSRSAEWNRGAYLVEGLAHCGACHTPRNALGAERASAQFAGGDVDNWQAFPLNDTSQSPVPWTVDALFAYLRTGSDPVHGVARGPMAEVVSNLSSVPESDVRAIANYMASVAGAPTPERERRSEDAVARAEQTHPGDPDRVTASNMKYPSGAAIYQAACAGCHESNRGVPYAGLNLNLSTGVSASDARNVANTVLTGLRPVPGERSSIMPGFAASMNDGQIADLLTFLRARFSDQPAWTDLDKTVREARSAQLAYVQTNPGPTSSPAEPSQRDKP